MQIRAGIVKTTLAIAASTLTASVMVGEHHTDSDIAQPVSHHTGSEISASTSPAASDTPGSGTNMELDLAKLNRKPPSSNEVELFATYTPPPPPAPPAAVAAISTPPPKPTAPPLPFKYLGRMVDAGVTTIFVNHGNQNMGIKDGDVIDNTYKVESITDSSVTLTYLPLAEKQTLNIGGGR